MDLASASAIVTGGGRGLGRAIVEALLAAGARAAVLDVDDDALADLARALPGVAGIRCDVADAADAGAGVAKAFDALGEVNVLVNNAGIIRSAPLVRLTAADREGARRAAVADWDRVIAADLSSVFYVTLNVAERMAARRTRGVIVNIGSISARGNAGQGAYAAAKAGVEALSRSWAKELGPLGIRAVTVAPGFADTPSTRAALAGSRLDEIKARIPLRRLASAAEVAGAVLAVIGNDYLNGTVVAVDGGLTL